MAFSQSDGATISLDRQEKNLKNSADLSCYNSFPSCRSVAKGTLLKIPSSRRAIHIKSGLLSLYMIFHSHLLRDDLGELVWCSKTVLPNYIWLVICLDLSSGMTFLPIMLHSSHFSKVISPDSHFLHQLQLVYG